MPTFRQTLEYIGLARPDDAPAPTRRSRVLDLISLFGLLLLMSALFAHRPIVAVLGGVLAVGSLVASVRDRSTT